MWGFTLQHVHILKGGFDSAVVSTYKMGLLPSASSAASSHVTACMMCLPQDCCKPEKDKSLTQSTSVSVNITAGNYAGQAMGSESEHTLQQKAYAKLTDGTMFTTG